MSRNSREITIEDINNNISIYDIISKYTVMNRYRDGYKGLCPFHSEKSPSFYIKDNGLFHCFGCEKKGFGVIDFVMQIENITFLQAKEFLIKDLQPNIIPKKIIKVIKKEVQPILIDFVDCNFSDFHNDYWKNLEMDQSWLNNQNVFAVKEWAIGSKNNMKKMKFTNNEIVFAYYAKDIDKVKILRIGPEITKETKWRTNVPNDYLWYYNEYLSNSPHELGFTAKSVKDSLVLKKLDRKSIATQNESSAILLENNIGKINNIFIKNIMCYGTDEQGKKQSITITKETGWGWFNTENQLYDQFDCEDLSDYLNLGFTYKNLDRLLKNKKL